MSTVEENIDRRRVRAFVRSLRRARARGRWGPCSQTLVERTIVRSTFPPKRDRTRRKRPPPRASAPAVVKSFKRKTMRVRFATAALSGPRPVVFKSRLPWRSAEPPRGNGACDKASLAMDASSKRSHGGDDARAHEEAGRARARYRPGDDGNSSTTRGVLRSRERRCARVEASSSSSSASPRGTPIRRDAQFG